MVACSPFGPAGEFAAARHGALTRSQAADHGLTPTVVRRLKRDRILDEPVPGVLVVVGSPPTWRQHLRVATLASRGAGVAGFRAAAALHGVDGFDEGPLELLVPTSRHIRLPALVVHRGPFEHVDLTAVDGIRCTSIARTLCDLGAVEPPGRVRIAVEWAWRHGVSRRWLRTTAERLARHAQRGPDVLLSLLDESEGRRVATESALEVQVEEVIGSLPGVVRQHPIHRSDGSFVARVDFAVPELRIAIEAHSRRHHVGPWVEQADAAREGELHAEGWIVRYVTDAQRRRPAELRSSLIRLMLARSRQLAA